MHESAYTTLRGEGRAELVDRKSRFLAYACPVKTEAEALAYLAAVKSLHTDATHHVYAYQIAAGNLTRYSDDGEPSGTAGLPVLDVIRKGGFTDAVLVVTRYFGGTLLGTGGLVRAYTAAARSAAEAAEIVCYRPFTECVLVCGYSEYQRLQTELTRRGIRADDTAFADAVTLRLAVPQEEFAAFAAAVSELTGGRSLPVQTGTRFAC